MFYLFQQASYADTWDRVKWVIDGDTVVLANGQKVRYIGINSPELARDGNKAEPYGNAAKRFNATFPGFLLNVCFYPTRSYRFFA